MGKKSGPPPPDYTAAAEKTAQSNKEAVTSQTWANRADQYSPFGSTTWDTQAYTDPSTGQQVTKWVENTNLTPETQAALDSQMRVQMARSQQAEDLIGRMQEGFSNEMDWSQLPAWSQGPGQAGGLQQYTGPQGYGPQQQMIDTSRQQTPGLQTNMGMNAPDIQQGLDFSGVQGAQGADVNRQRAEDAIYQSAASRLDPQWQQRQSDMETQLANAGITRNSEAYSRAMDDFNRQKTDAYNQAQMSAITGGGVEAQRNQGMDLALRGQQVGEIGQQGQFANQAAGQAFGQDVAGGAARNQAYSQMFGFGQSAREQQRQAQQQAYQQSLAGAQFGLGREQQAFGQQQAAGAQNFNQQMAQSNYQNQLRQQQLQEMIQKRGFNLNEMQALLQGQQVNMPQFASYNQAGNAGGTNYSGAVSDQFGAAMQQQQMKNQATSDIIGGVAGAAMMFSDRAVKRLIKPIGTDPRGFRIWWFRYFGETLPRVGVVAQEVQRYAPELVSKHPSGLLMVDYARI